MTGAPLNRPPLGMILCTALLALLFGGCTRGPSSPFIDSPLDPDLRSAEMGVRDKLLSQDYQLPAQQEYVIGPGDIVSITLVGRPDILGLKEGEEKYSITISDNPMITLPLIGSVQVHGKSAAQLQEQLLKAYSSYIQNPVPLVAVENYHYNQVAVLGAVAKPGKYSLDWGDTLAEGLFKAGGLTFGGDSGGLPPGRYLKIYREKTTRKERSEMSTEELLQRVREGDWVMPREEIIIPIERFIFQGELTFNIPLQPGDIVFVPPAGAVIVQGSVRNAGVVFLGPSLRTLSEVLTESRGLRWGAASRVEVIRTRADGSQLIYFMPSRKILKNKHEDFLLYDNDRIVVHRHPVRGTIEDIFSIFRASVQTGASATYNPAQ